MDDFSARAAVESAEALVRNKAATRPPAAAAPRAARPLPPRGIDVRRRPIEATVAAPRWAWSVLWATSPWWLRLAWRILVAAVVFGAVLMFLTIVGLFMLYQSVYGH